MIKVTIRTAQELLLWGGAALTCGLIYGFTIQEETYVSID
jgi:hypothetical protein